MVQSPLQMLYDQNLCLIIFITRHSFPHFSSWYPFGLQCINEYIAPAHHVPSFHVCLQCIK